MLIEIDKTYNGLGCCDAVGDGGDGSGCCSIMTSLGARGGGGTAGVSTSRGPWTSPCPGCRWWWWWCCCDDDGGCPRTMAGFGASLLTALLEVVVEADVPPPCHDDSKAPS